MVKKKNCPGRLSIRRSNLQGIASCPVKIMTGEWGYNGRKSWAQIRVQESKTIIE